MNRSPLRVLFVCRYNMVRSVTAENLFSAHPHLETKSAGTADQAVVPVDSDLLEWADMIFVMEQKQKKQLHAFYGSGAGSKPIINLGIEDMYEYMDTDLIDLLKERVTPHLNAFLGDHS